MKTRLITSLTLLVAIGGCAKDDMQSEDPRKNRARVACSSSSSDGCGGSGGEADTTSLSDGYKKCLAWMEEKYKYHLGRSPTSADTNYHCPRMEKGVISYEAFEREIIRSGEYCSNWMKAKYSAILARLPNEADISHHCPRIANGATTYAAFEQDLRACAAAGTCK